MPTDGSLVSLINATLLHNTEFAPYWGLLGLKALDFASGLAKAIAGRDVQPAKLLRTPAAFLLITGAVALCLALNAVSPLFAPVVSVILVSLAAADAASIVQNVHDWFVVRGQEPPAALKTVAATLKTLQPKTEEGARNG